MTVFYDRSDAGHKLALALRETAPHQPLVVALPRGGIPVGYEVARALRAPLDVWLVRKIGVPGQPEVGMGAIAEGGEVQCDRLLIDQLKLSSADWRHAEQRAHDELQRRVLALRGGHSRPHVEGHHVILVDDGIATGWSMLAAARAIRSRSPRELVLAVPVAAPDSLQEVAVEFDRVVCLHRPEHFQAVGQWYRVFRQVSDAEALMLLDRARREYEQARTLGA